MVNLAQSASFDEAARNRLLGYCNDLKRTEKKIVRALKLVLRPPNVG